MCYDIIKTLFQRIYTPHFLHSAFSALRIFYAPHFLHSVLRTPRTTNTQPFYLVCVQKVWFFFSFACAITAQLARLLVLHSSPLIFEKKKRLLAFQIYQPFPIRVLLPSCLYGSYNRTQSRVRELFCQSLVKKSLRWGRRVADGKKPSILL